MGENVTVVGCGYVGSVLAAYWQQQGHTVTGTTTRPERLTELQAVLAHAKIVRGHKPEEVTSACQRQDVVVVGVAPPRAQRGDLGTYHATYLPIAQNIAPIIAAATAAPHIVYLSSCSVYGDRQGDWVDETALIQPTSEHIEILYEAEQTLLQAATANQCVCILRLAGIYGPGRELTKRYANLAGQTLPGKGDRVINWVHLADIVGAIEFARAKRLTGIYNVVDDSEMTVRQQVDLVCTTHQLPPVNWDESQPAQVTKSLRVCNAKL
ncbi:MAG: SDR family oxidoreductase, partial [Cyanobacteria bacterium P01_H01_bin.58]